MFQPTMNCSALYRVDRLRTSSLIIFFTILIAMLSRNVQALRLLRIHRSKIFTRLASSEIQAAEIGSVKITVSDEMRALGLSEDLLAGVSAQGIIKPTPVQKAVIPRLLAKENIVMAASTGSGKTLAYVLPAIENLHGEEMLGYVRQVQRPRCLILVPTRDLARQVLTSVKQVGHFAKISSAAVLGGEQYSVQRRSVSTFPHHCHHMHSKAVTFS
jgi:superfamily II DNA/RNA helicase